MVLAASSILLIALYSSNARKKRRQEDDESFDTPEHHWSDSVELPPHIEREIMKEKRRQEKVPYLARKTPMYDNCQMLSPDGELLCTISTKKGRWYVQKSLAEWTGENQIQLKFEPKGRSVRGDNRTYITSPKLNICVSCGRDDYVMRHYVVPYAYRTLLPAKYKSHLSHDIVILCPKCHLHCEQQAHHRSKEIDAMHRPLGDDDTSNKFIMDKSLKRVRSAATTLMNWKHQVPAEKIAEYDRLVRSHLGLSDTDMLTLELLQKAIDVQLKKPNPKYISGAELVVQAFGGDDSKIEHFIRDWRQHFLDTVQPRFLAEGWSVDSPVTSKLG